MKSVRRLLLSALLLYGTASWASAQTSTRVEESIRVPPSDPNDAPTDSENAAELEKFATFLKSKPDLTVYEGLPHQNLERKAFASELSRKDVVDGQGYFFYSTPLKISGEDADKLREAFLKHTPSGMSISTAVTACGGFHPDYLVTWSNKTERYSTLICLGCEEIIISARHFSLYRSFRSAFYNELTSILTKYVVNRPETAPEPQ